MDVLARQWMLGQNSGFRRLLFFAVVFAALQLGWQAARGTSVERWVVHDGTVVPAARLINLLTPGQHAIAIRATLHAPGGGINILNGCEGVEALFLLVAAFLAASLRPRTRWLGIALGSIVVFAINQVRILVLFYAYRADPSWFDCLHATVTPIAVIVLVGSYFYSWLVYDSSSRSQPS
ncbi:MAG: exosortase/archaeosortase family protein [Cyanobacteria bacterium SZAS LIN-2]|nr:exosortase/archaeosortase family protein [Cyanobacteria bacterium SZAS LIN-2]